MEADPVLTLKVLVGDELLDIADAAKRFPYQVSKAVQSACHIIDEITLPNIFRSSLLSSRQRTPYRLNAAVASCVQGMLPKDSLEMRFFQEGHVRAVAALAAATADNKSIPRLLRSQSPEQISALIDDIAKMAEHGDFRNMCLLAEAKASGPVDPTPLRRPRASSAKVPQRKRHRANDQPVEDRALSVDTGPNVEPHLPQQDMEVPDSFWDYGGMSPIIIFVAGAHYRQAMF